MNANTANIDLLIQYSLLAAGDEDEYFDRQLGPIHLIKYVYLADLIYAERNNGETFTGVNWQFYKFGPWSQEVNARIEPALAIIHANKNEHPSNYEGKEDWVRWDLNDDYLFNEKQKALPASITLKLKSIIHKFGKDTPSLLNYVYRTKPILFSAPNEYLDFSLVADEIQTKDLDRPALRLEGLSQKKQEKFKEKISELRKKYHETKNQTVELINPVSNPRYDEVYQQGINWLEEIAGDFLHEKDLNVEFSKDIWKSETRRGEDDFS